MTTTAARYVIRGNATHAHPIVGKVLGQEDEDRVLVAWGDEMYADEPRVRVEWIEDLRPVRKAA